MEVIEELEKIYSDASENSIWGSLTERAKEELP